MKKKSLIFSMFMLLVSCAGGNEWDRKVDEKLHESGMKLKSIESLELKDTFGPEKFVDFVGIHKLTDDLFMKLKLKCHWDSVKSYGDFERYNLTVDVLDSFGNDSTIQMFAAKKISDGSIEVLDSVNIPDCCYQLLKTADKIVVDYYLNSLSK